MKSRHILLLATITLALSGCGSSSDQTSTEPVEEVDAEEIFNPQAQESETEIESEIYSTAEVVSTEVETTQVTTTQTQVATEPFISMNGMEFAFSSGAGGWGTYMVVYEDGSFEGEYFDAEVVSVGDDYPGGTYYTSTFGGMMSDPVKIDDYTYEVSLGMITYANEVDTEEIVDGVRYVYSTAQGLTDTDKLYIYLPGKPLSELSETFISWVSNHPLFYEEPAPTTLPFYAIENVATGDGFTGE